MTTSSLPKRRIQQIPVENGKGHDAIINATYLSDISEALAIWKSSRVVLVHSKALAENTDVIKNLSSALGPSLVARKSGVGSHSPYADVLDIAKLLQQNAADCLISIGSSSYSDACKIARLLHSTLPPGSTEKDMEALVDPQRGITLGTMKPPTIRLILVPTSLSASEWNPTSSATNPAKKKQHFDHIQGAADLILLDPVIASTSPEMLWLSSGVRAVDHCVETMCNPSSNPQADEHMETGLRALLKGLKEYKEGRETANRDELLHGVSECQVGSREAMMGILVWRIGMGASHAIGHQLGSVAGVLHGVTSCVMLSPVLRYWKAKGQQIEPQRRVLDVFNEVLGWQEKEAADAMARFVKLLGLPSTLSDVGVTTNAQVEEIAEKTLTDVWGREKRQLDTKEDVMEVLNMAR